MKKSFMTRVLATGLSVAMAFSLSTATNLVTAEAAVPTLVDAVTGGSGKAVTVNVDAVAKLKINPNVSKTYSVASVKKSSKKIRTAVNKKGTVVTVRGLVATEEGKPAAIKVSFTAKKTGKTSKYTFASKVTVVAPKPAVAELTEVTQKEARKFAATLSTTVEKAEVADFSIVRKSDNAVIPVKSVTLDDAKTGVTIETFVDLADGKEYTFTYTAKDEAKTASSKDLTVTAGKIEKLDLTTTNVTAATADDGVKVVTKDANDVVLNTYSFSDAAAKYINVTVTPTTAGYRDGNKIYLPEVGNTATVKVEYHTYKYVDGKEEGALTETFTVTAVADATVMNNFVYTITDAISGEPAWPSASFKENHQVAIGDGAKVWFKFKDSKGNDKTKGYKVSSSDANVMALQSKTLAGSADPAIIAGAKEGTAYIVVKNSKDELVTTLPVTVVGKKVATTLELSTQAVTVSNSSSANAISTVKAYVKDQYGNKMSLVAGATTSVAITPLSGPNNLNVTTYKDALVNSLGTITCAGDTMSIAVSGKAFQTKGSYVYKVEVKKGDKTVTNSLTVNVTEPAASGTNTSYTIELAAADVDMVVDKYNKDAKMMTFKVAKLENGVVWDYLKTNSIASISVKSSDGTSELKVVSGGASTIGAIVTSGNATTTYIEKMAKKDMTYLVKITLQGNKDLTATFNVKDSQLTVGTNITNISDAITATDVKDVLVCSTADGDKNHIEYFYDNQKKTITAGDIVKVKATQITGEKTVTVYSVTLKLLVDTGANVLVEVPVDKVFTTTNTAGWTGSVVAP